MKFQRGDRIVRDCEAPTHAARGYCWEVDGLNFDESSYVLLDPDDKATPVAPISVRTVNRVYARVLPEQGGQPHPTPEPRRHLLWAAVDLDGTLAEGIWTPDNPTHEIGRPIQRNVDKARRLAAQGYKIVVHTSRAWTDYETIETWLNHYGIPYKAIVCGKLLAKMYVDDRAVRADEEEWEL